MDKAALSGTFQDIARKHALRYPLMRPQDYAKLAYQNEFGPEHLAPGKEQILSSLREEWGAVLPDGSPHPPEPIGNGLCRFHLTCEYDFALAAPLLAELFYLTAQRRRGTAAGLAEDLALLEALDIPGMTDWLADYRRQGCPPVHHSQVFRAAYHPHYRLLTEEYAGYFPALLYIAALVEQGTPAIVAIDGRCGSGKTRFAELIARLYPCNLFHMDDFYLPPGQRAEGWETTPGGNMDFARFLREVLAPAYAGRDVIYRPYDCQTGALKAPTRMPAALLTIVEGSYSQHPALKSRFDLRIFLTCSKAEQRRRLKAREKDRFASFEARWIPMEERYIRACGIDRSSELILDTSGFWAGT